MQSIPSFTSQTQKSASPDKETLKTSKSRLSSITYYRNTKTSWHHIFYICRATLTYKKIRCALLQYQQLSPLPEQETERLTICKLIFNIANLNIKANL